MMSTSKKPYTYIGSDVNRHQWMDNNPWAQTDELFSLAELQEILTESVYTFLERINTDKDIPSSRIAQKAKELTTHLEESLDNYVFKKAYQRAAEKLNAAMDQRRKEIGDELLFAGSLEEIAKHWDPAPAADSSEELFAGFRIRLFWWYVEKMEVSDSEMDLTRAVAFVNNISRHLGDPTLQHLTDKSDGTDKSPADCADC